MSGTDVETGMPVIGNDSDFEGPKENSVRTAPTIPRKDAKNIEETLSGMEDTVDLEKPLRPLTPEEKAEEYAKNLKDVAVTSAEALGIMEAIMVKGYYEESSKIGKSVVVLRTRLYRDTQRLYQALEHRELNLAATIQDFVNRYNLAGSIVSVGERTFPHVADPLTDPDSEIDARFEDRLKMLPRLPDFVTARLMQLVFVFDNKMRAVFAEGAPQDF